MQYCNSIVETTSRMHYILDRKKSIVSLWFAFSSNAELSKICGVPHFKFLFKSKKLNVCSYFYSLKKIKMSETAVNFNFHISNINNLLCCKK